MNYRLLVSCLTTGMLLFSMGICAQENSQRPTLSDEYQEYNQFRFGGYGEMVGKFMDYGTNRYSGLSGGNTRENRNSISIPRFIVAFDYKFNPKWILGAEIEFESGGTGVATELENSENGEYETEMEKGGEVAIEQFHITRLISKGFNIRAGHMIVPVGLTNAHHEPINFFGTVRPESETTILPSTWHDTGISFFGSLGKGYAAFNYQAMVVAGLNADGFGRDGWVKGGKQGLFEEDNFTSPGYVLRVDYVGIPGLRLGGSFYYCANTAANADKAYKYSSFDKAPVRIYNADVQYKGKWVTLRGNLIYGNLTNSYAISNVSLSNKSSYYHGAMRNTAHEALAYGAEIGFNLKQAFKGKQFPTVYPFARYEYVNPQQSGEKGQTLEVRNQISKWVVGANWYALPNLVVKADYSTRQIGTQKVFGSTGYNSENEFSIGVAYIGWFVRK